MTDQRMVRVRKAGGGSTIPWQGQSYSWPEAGAVTEVPPEFAEVLLKIPGGGFSVVQPGEGRHEITEPAPKAAGEITEPEPRASTPAQERPRQRAGGRVRSTVPSSQD